jgi:hypothetical protein
VHVERSFGAVTRPDAGAVVERAPVKQDGDHPVGDEPADEHAAERDCYREQREPDRALVDDVAGDLDNESGEQQTEPDERSRARQLRP